MKRMTVLLLEYVLLLIAIQGFRRTAETEPPGTYGTHQFELFIPPPREAENFAQTAADSKLAFERANRLATEITEQDKRLKDVLMARHYYIRLRPYFPAPGVTLPEGRNMTFDGVTTFIFRVKKATATFTLYSFNLEYQSITLMDDNGLPLNIQSHTIDTRLSHLIITPSDAPVVGKTYLLQFKYTGKINPYTDGGMYYTYYNDIKNTTHWMVSTHMENGFQARSVFPCLDEPSYKAVFHMTLIHPTQLIALSNAMERAPEDFEPGWSITRFPPTPKMSSYLVALAIGPFVHTQRINQAGTLVRIWGWTGQDKYLEFAAEVSAKCLYSLGVYLNFPYPMSKSDQIGLPEFRAGAMENFGLIIYKYQYIAFNPDVHSTYVKEYAAQVMCHELAHQWFGDIVTASWWSELVVNEGFAAYWEYYNQAMALPEQAPFLDSEFLIDATEKALNYDANLLRSHPIVVVPTGRYFDPITYEKGSSMYRMARLTLGDQAFQEALQDYIRTYQFSNADHEMLFAKFTTAAQRHAKKDWCGRPLNVTKFLDPWFLQECFPLLTVTNNQPTSPAHVTQQPFNNISLLPISKFSYNYSWPIPLVSENYKNATPHFSWIKPAWDESCPSDQKAMKVAGKAERSIANHWDYENANRSAFARVEYDDIGYARLLVDLKANRDTHYKMSDKIALIGDQIAFLHRKMRTNQQFSYRRLIELITILVPDYPYSGLFELIQPVIEELEPMFEDGLDYGLFQRFIDKLVLANYNKLRWTVTGDWNNDVARYLMLPYAVRFDVGDSMAEAVKLFTGFQSDCAQTTTGVDKCSKVHPDLRKAVYCAGIKHGTASDFQFMMKMYKQQVVHGFYFYQEYYAMLFGMSCTQSAEDMNSLIATMFDTYRPFTSYNPFAFLSKNPAASDIMLKYIKSNADKVLHSPHLSQYLSAMIATWRTDNRLSQYEALVSELSPKADEAQKEIFNEYRTNLKAQVDWHTRHYRDIIHIFYDFFVKKGDEPFSERLPKDIMPLTYDAFIQPYFPSSAHYDWTKNMTFDSTINVTMRVITATDKVNISVHRLLIQPTDIHLADMTGATLEYLKVVKDYDNGVMTIYLRNQLPVDSVFYLFIKSVGYIFYGASEGAYTNFGIFEFNGKMAWIFSTDDESGPDIRSVWPCFDEPYFKANWTVTIKHASDMIALCNMINTGLVIDENSFGWATTSFTPTPPIASYLVAMAIGHFASMEMISKHGVLVRVWAWTGMEQYAQEGLEMAAGTADFMTEMLEIPYALPKMDLVALPQYIQTSKALENWGVICMIYDSVLVDRQYATAHDYSEVARVTPHEVVHQWFGNLVTSEWWSLIFLNEAFAQYYYSSGANYTYPQQEKYARFVRFWLADYALTHDGNPAITRPIITDRKPIFTYAPYYKGASVLYMLNNAITVPIMQEGLREYFHRNAWKTTTETMLWSAITDITKAHNIKGWNNELLDVQALMDPWTKQENFPILKLTTNAGQVTYSQEPFIKNISILEPSRYHYKWPIPVHSQTDEEHHSLHYFVPDEEWSRPLGSSWQVDNPGSVGCYRVWYDESTWAPIREQLSRDATVFDELTRAQFIGDAFALRERGSLPWSRVLEMVEFMADEIEYPPHFAFQRVRDQLLNAFKGTADMPNIKKFVAKSVRKAYQERGWQKSSSWTDASVATLATEHACLTDNAECLNKAKSLFDAFITNCEYSMTGTGLCNSDVAPDVRRTQYCYGLAQTPNGIDVVEKLYKWFVKNSYYFRRDDDNLLHALACLQDEATKKRLIADVLDGHYPVVLLEYIAQRDSTDTLLWDYLVANSDAVFYGVPSLSYYMDVAVGSWNTQQQLDKIDAFLNSLGTTISAENAKVIMDHKAKVQQNIDWLKSNRDEIMTWINANIQ